MRPRPHSLRGLLPVLLAVLLSGGCAPPEEPPIAPVVGVWVCDDPRFAGRSLEVTAARELVLGLGEEGTERHPLVAVLRGAPEAAGLHLVLRYRGEGGALEQLSLEYLPERDQVRLGSRPALRWRRAPPS